VRPSGRRTQARILFLSEVCPQLPFPFAVKQRFILPWRLSLLECSLPLGLPSCRLAFRLPEVLGPFNGICASASPVWGGVSASTPVPLSGFLNLSAVSAGRSCVALFHATTVPGILPSELFPHKDRAPLSRPLAPLQLSTGVLSSTLSCARSPPVSPTSTLSRGCLDPPATMDSVSPSRGSVPPRPGGHG